ncbi:MAG: hypothetical protein RI907_1995 [Pseudomonadota bacterium]|jgi:type II secretory pathway pseudopilin PulG
MRKQGAPAQGGFTYFMLLWWVALSGVMLVALSQNWRFERRREREIDMVARAQEIQSALASYHRRVVGGQPAAWPVALEDLVADRRGPVVVHHLRRLWTDPLTGRADWGLIREGEASGRPAEGGIHGVFSRASGVPIRAPQGIHAYVEWRFEASTEPNGP